REVDVVVLVQQLLIADVGSPEDLELLCRGIHQRLGGDGLLRDLIEVAAERFGSSPSGGRGRRPDECLQPVDLAELGKPLKDEILLIELVEERVVAADPRKGTELVNDDEEDRVESAHCPIDQKT